MTSLSSDHQLSKLEQATLIADQASATGDLAARLGALVLYAGMVDFLAIQAARLIEQIVLKWQLSSGMEPTFQPSDDSYFYSRKISTAKILKGIRKFLPFGDPTGQNGEEAKRITKLAEDTIDRGLGFLNHRDPLLHQIGNPVRTLDEVLNMVGPAIAEYHAFVKAHTLFFKAAGPYRFGPAEMERFYGAGRKVPSA